MRDDRKQNWLTFLFFSISGIVFATSLYLVTTGASAAQPTLATVVSAAPVLPGPDEARVRVVLERDTRMRLGKMDLIYRGIQNRQLRLDVIIRELDPQYAYRHAIALDQAVRGFRLGGVDLKLLSARASRAKILWHRNS